MRLLVLGLLATFLPGQQREPYLFVRLAGAKTRAAPRASSNERIPLQICIQANTVSDSFEQPRIGALNQAPGGPPANVKLSIWKVTAAGRQDVAFRVNSSGAGKDLTVWWVDADIDLLEDNSVRLERARKFVEWMASQGADARSQLLQAPGGKERMAAYFEEQYIRNPPGEYEIVARYAPATVGDGKGTLTALPFRLTITEASDFFENLKQKLIHN
jgi:hypothetical protein